MGSAQIRLVGGRATVEDQAIVSINPATEAPLGEVPEWTAAEVRAAVQSGRDAARTWGRLPIRERAAQVMRFRDAILERAEEIIEAIVHEGGKTRGEALGTEVLVVVDLATYFCKRAEQILAPR